MLDKLFNSKVRADLLSLFLLNRDKKYYIQEVARLIDGDPSNIFRELKNLEKLGIFTSEREGNLKYYKINEEFALYSALAKLIEDSEQQKSGEWFLVEEIPGYTPSALYHAFDINIVNEHLKSVGFGRQCTSALTVYNEGLCSMWVLRSEFDSVVERTMEILTKEPAWMKNYQKTLESKLFNFEKEVEKLEKKNLAALSNEELFSLYEYHFNNYGEISLFAWIQAGVDYGDSALSKHLLHLLDQKIKSRRIKNASVGEFFASLTTPVQTTLITEEHEDLLKIVSKIRKNDRLAGYFRDSETRLIVKDLATVDAKVSRLIEDHARNYGWIGYGLTGPSWSKEYFIDLIASLIRQEVKSDSEVVKKEDQGKKIKKYEKILELTEDEKGLFSLARDLVASKSIRKELTFYFYSVMENVYREIGRRFYLSLNQIRFMYPHEVKMVLTTGNFDVKKINQRPVWHVRFSKKSDKDILLEGKRAEEYVNKLHLKKAEVENVKMILGDCACPGRVKGAVKIVNLVEDMAKVEEGDVLVSLATNPELVPAMKRAGAIISDVGGITCHAAIVSRELNIPCIIGTKVSTRALKDGDIVDVDATHGKITVIEKG